MTKKKAAPKKTTKKATTTRNRKAYSLQTVEQAAYLKAESDGFRGDPVHYWLAAEAEITATQAKGR